MVAFLWHVAKKRHLSLDYQALQGSKQGSNPCPPVCHFNNLSHFFCGANGVQNQKWHKFFHLNVPISKR